MERRLDRILAHLEKAPKIDLRRIHPVLARWAQKTELAREIAQDRLCQSNKDNLIAGLPPRLVKAVRPNPFAFPLSSLRTTSPQREWSLDDQVTLFHDCSLSQILIRQNPTPETGRVAPHELQIECFEFQGSFFSFKFDLPFQADVTSDTIISIRAHIVTSEDIQAHARLSIAKGAHTEAIIRDVAINDPFATAEFDLYFAETRLDGSQSMWIDLSFSNIAQSKIHLRDIVLFQTNRAEA